jgi:hypothetical protein
LRDFKLAENTLVMLGVIKTESKRSRGEGPEVRPAIV